MVQQRAEGEDRGGDGLGVTAGPPLDEKVVDARTRNLRARRRIRHRLGYEPDGARRRDLRPRPLHVVFSGEVTDFGFAFVLSRPVVSLVAQSGDQIR